MNFYLISFVFLAVFGAGAGFAFLMGRRSGVVWNGDCPPVHKDKSPLRFAHVLFSWAFIAILCWIGAVYFGIHLLRISG